MSQRKERHTPTADQLHAQHHAAKYAAARALGLSWFRHHPGDMLSLSRGWPVVAVGLFHVLRDCQWDMGSLPGDANELRRLVHVDARDWRSAWPIIASHFPLDSSDDCRRNPWLASERFDSLARHWQQTDAALIRHGTGYAGATADAYARALADAAAGADADGHATEHAIHNHNHTSGSRKKTPTRGEIVLLEGGAGSKNHG